jgi:hypothetical protein
VGHWSVEGKEVPVAGAATKSVLIFFTNDFSVVQGTILDPIMALQSKHSRYHLILDVEAAERSCRFGSRWRKVAMEMPKQRLQGETYFSAKNNNLPGMAEREIRRTPPPSDHHR